MVDKKRPTLDPKSRRRGAKVRVKTARGRKISSTRWLQRQLNDPYVSEARRLGYRSRAAFKLIEIDDKHEILKGRKRILDLGAAPGGWCQVASERTKGADILGVDLLEVEGLTGVRLMVKDFMDEDAEDVIEDALGGKADLVMSDMANSATGHKQTDHIRTMALCEAALDFAVRILSPGGHFVAKVLQGGTEKQLLDKMRQHFKVVKHVKPSASRQESTELYVMAKEFKA